MNTRKTFNGAKPRRQLHAPSAVLMAAVIILSVCAIAAWIGVIGLYASDERPVEHSQVDVKPSDLRRSAIGGGVYR